MAKPRPIEIVKALVKDNLAANRANLSVLALVMALSKLKVENEAVMALA
jgi:hypothetical protein